MDENLESRLERSKTMKWVMVTMMVVGAVFGFAVLYGSAEAEPLWRRVLLGVGGAVASVAFLAVVLVFLRMLLVFGEAGFITLRDWRRLRKAKAIAYDWLRYGGWPASKIESVKRRLESAPNNREAQLLLQLINKREKDLDDGRDRDKA